MFIRNDICYQGYCNSKRDYSLRMHSDIKSKVPPHASRRWAAREVRWRFLESQQPLKFVVALFSGLILVLFVSSSFYALFGNSDLGLPFRVSFMMTVVAYVLYEVSSLWEIAKTRNFSRVPFEIFGWGFAVLLILGINAVISQFVTHSLTSVNLSSLDNNSKWLIGVGLLIPAFGAYDQLSWVAEIMYKLLRQRIWIQQ
jgi:hypothetical protein